MFKKLFKKKVVEVVDTEFIKVEGVVAETYADLYDAWTVYGIRYIGVQTGRTRFITIKDRQNEIFEATHKIIKTI